jgi:hypothetical protein
MVSMSAKTLTHEEVVARLAIVKPRLQILGKYSNKRTSVELKCLDCFHQWVAKLDNKWNGKQGNGCPKCAITNRYLTDDEREKSRIRVIERTRNWRKNNPEKYLEQCRHHRIKNRAKLSEYGKIYRANNAEKARVYHKAWSNDNRERRRDYNTIRQRKWRPIALAKNPNYRIGEVMRTRIKRVLKGERKYDTTLKLLGMTLDELRRHLESKFKPGMTWENYGYKGWHIDHILPCSAFDLTDLEDQKECFHYTNLQPLWWWENLSKSNKI